MEWWSVRGLPWLSGSCAVPSRERSRAVDRSGKPSFFTSLFLYLETVSSGSPRLAGAVRCRYPSRMASSEYRRSRRVEFADTDMAGIAHFTSLLRYMEETEHAFLRSLGLSVHFVDDDGHSYGFPRLAVRGEFLEPLRFEDEMEIHLRVVRVGGTSLTYQFLLARDDEPAAQGEISVACVRLHADGQVEKSGLPATFRELLTKSASPRLTFRGPFDGPSDHQGLPGS